MVISIRLIFFGLWQFSLVDAVCYPEVGCFENTGGFISFFITLPQSPDVIKVTFSLYTQSKINSPEDIHYRNVTTIIFSSLVPTLKTRIIVHGYFDDPLKANHWSTRMKNELLSSGPMNVIIVRWTEGAIRLNYVQAAANTRVVGKQIALLIQMIIILKGGKLTDYHIIGHSLGAQIASFAGNNLNEKLGRITGLDPAGPSFEGSSIDARIDETDALFVDVIHSNGLPLLVLGFGMFIPAGHVDFYPNGGKQQPGCALPLVGLLGAILSLKFDFQIEYIVACNHLRVVELFIESTNSFRDRNCKFCAYNCESYNKFLTGACNIFTTSSGVMGFHADEYPLRGSAYVITRGGSPYCAPTLC